ncbi:MAG TPA: DUF2059 domain-containing protein [Polyangia bacterium]|jgi:hypothetical protein
MRYILAAFLAAVLFTTGAPRADGSGTKPIEEDVTRALITPREYDATMERISKQWVEEVRVLPGQKGPEDKVGAIRAALKESMSYDDMIRSATQIYGKYFNKRELEEIGAFFRSPTGKKYGELQQTMKAELVTTTGPGMLIRLRAALKKRGLEPTD